MSPLRIGLVGCGRLAREVHLPLLGAMPDVAVVAVADPDPVARAAATRLAPGAAPYPDHRALLAADLDAVVACPPTAAHADVACDVLEAGRALYLEKPIATTLADAERVVVAWRTAAVPAMVGFNYRLNPLYADLRRRVRAGEVGPVIAVRTTFSTRSGHGGWRGDRAAGGGALLDLAAHHVDLVRDLLGEEVAEVSAGLWSRHADDDTVVLDLRTTSGVPVQTFCSLSAVEDDRVEVIGEGGVLRVSRYESLAVEGKGVAADGALGAAAQHLVRSAAGAPYLLQKRRAPWGEPSFRLALERFADAVRGGAPATPDPVDGYRCLAVLVAAQEAANRRVVVSLDVPPPIVTAPSPEAPEPARAEAEAEHVAEAPDLSVVVIMPRGGGSFAAAFDRLAEQTIRDRIELVFVVPEGVDPALPDGLLGGFAGWQLIRVPEMQMSGPPRAVGVRAARAPVVVPVEDHCFPQPGWAEGLLGALEVPGAVAAGPSFRNGNPSTRASWVDYLLNFGAVSDHVETAPAAGTAWHNTAYRRDVLIPYGDALGEQLDVEGPLQEDLRRRGHVLVQSGTAEVHHLNFSHPGWLLAEHAVNGRQYGAARSAGWSPGQRALHAASAPLIPLARLLRLRHAARRAGHADRLGAMTLPLALAALSASAAGEVVGSLFGPGRAPEQKFDMEFDRHRFMVASDRRALAAGSQR